MTDFFSEPPVPGDPNLGPGSRSRRRWFLGVSGALLVIILWVFRDVLVPFLLALVLAYVLTPLVKAGERITVAGRRPPRWAVVVALYTVLISSLTAITLVAVPRLSAEFSKLASDAPRLVAQVRLGVLPAIEQRLLVATEAYRAELVEASEEETAPQETDVAAAAAAPVQAHNVIRVRPGNDGSYDVVLPLEGLHISPDTETGGYRVAPQARKQEAAQDITAALTAAISRAMRNTERSTVTLFKTAQAVVATLARGVFGFVMMWMVSAYLLVTSDRIFDFFRALYPPSKRDQFDDLVQRMDRGLAGVVRGQLTIALVNGVLSGIGFYVIGLKYWVFLTLVATVMSVIPIFGSILSTIPAVLVALPDGVGQAVLVLAWVVVIHQVEANLLNPKIMGDAARVHPVLVVFALLAGEHVAGIVGALFAVPFLSITQTLFLYLRERYLGIPRSASTAPAPPT